MGTIEKDKEENEDVNDSGNAKTSPEYTERSARENKDRTETRQDEEEEERIHRNGERNTDLFPSNNPEMSHEWAARSPGKY